MSDLETLKAQLENEDCCWHCGRLVFADSHKCPHPHPGVARLLEQRSALLTALKQHEATIAERDSRIAELLEILHFRESASSDLLAKALATIQQQARELELMDKAFAGGLVFDEEDWDTFRRARKRRSARAQQAEAKKEE